jgi:DNA topoisomerase-1
MPFVASIKENIVKKKIGAEKSKLLPTDLGRSVLTFMCAHFGDLFNYGFTSRMEARLDATATADNNGETCKEILRELWLSFKDRYDVLLQTKKVARSANEEAKPVCEWNGVAVVKKSGRYGEYYQCGDETIPCKPDDDPTVICRRFEEKKANSAGVTFKKYAIRTGKYGPYIVKTSVKKSQFVAVPKDLDASVLTEKEVEAIYKLGSASLEAKAGKTHAVKKRNKI